MSNFFYWKLSLTTIKKNKKIYIPYILTCVGTMAVFYIMYSIFINKGLKSMSGGTALRSILGFGTIIIGIFSIIFLLYTNSFLIKRRKKELGLYNILGMEKKHISKLIACETFFIFLITIIAGLGIGIILSRLLFLLLLNFTGLDTTIKFAVEKDGVIASIAVFAAIFAVMLIYNLLQVGLSKPIELLKGGSVGEREPKSKWILTLLGIACLGAGYYIALTTDSPLKALNLFFTAVVLVIAGTYALFISGTITVLKMLKKNKSYYYKPNHFIGISNMIYRMKQNATGLANICILSTMVLVMLSTTTCLYIGVDSVLKNRYPYDITVNVMYASKENISEIKSLSEKKASELGLKIEGVREYTKSDMAFVLNGESLEKPSSEKGVDEEDIFLMTFIPLDDYNNMMSKDISLQDNEVMVYGKKASPFKDAIDIMGKSFIVKGYIDELDVKEDMDLMDNSYYIIVPNLETIESIIKSESSLGNESDYISYKYNFNVDGNAEDQRNLTGSIQKELNDKGIESMADSRESARHDFVAVYGGLFFIGILLGLLFIMATVLIIYYKQVSEGYDDKERFEIMQKVGMDKMLIKKSINSQTKTVFFMPLIAAVVHVAFAFRIITKLLLVFNLTDTVLFIKCVIGVILVFTIFYMAVYLLTAKSYYKIVGE